MKNYSQKVKTAAVVILIAAAAVLIFNYGKPEKTETAPDGIPNSGNIGVSVLDEFAKCLTEKGAVMYGAEWCPYCKEEIRTFGESFKFIDYVECPQKPNRCIKAGVEAYPTWIFADGKKLVGRQGIDKLALESGCQIQQ